MGAGGSRLLRGLDLGYCCVFTGRQSLQRQLDALTVAGILTQRIYRDNKTGASVDRPGLTSVLGYAREGDTIVVHTHDRLRSPGKVYVIRAG